jgi:hypothetical protein
LPTCFRDGDANEAGAEGGAGDEGAVASYRVGLGEGGVVEGEVGVDVGGKGGCLGSRLEAG